MQCSMSSNYVKLKVSSCNMLEKYSFKLKQPEHLRSEDTPRPMITHTIDQFILNPNSILLTSSYQIPSQNKVKAAK